MLIWMSVKNFGKIEEARICINKFSVLVGPNNSGKTFLMQLAYGLNDEIYKLINVEDLKATVVEEKSNYIKYIFNSDTVSCVEESVNKHLKEQK